MRQEAAVRLLGHLEDAEPLDGGHPGDLSALGRSKPPSRQLVLACLAAPMSLASRQGSAREPYGRGVGLSALRIQLLGVRRALYTTPQQSLTRTSPNIDVLPFGPGPSTEPAWHRSHVARRLCLWRSQRSTVSSRRAWDSNNLPSCPRGKTRYVSVKQQRIVPAPAVSARP